MHTGITFTSPARTASRAVAGLAGAALVLGVTAPLPGATAAATGGITGTVTDGTTPLEGIVVTVLDLDPFTGDVAIHDTTTDASGAYSIQGVEADPYYRVQFSDPGGQWATEYYDDSVTPVGGGAAYAQWVAVEPGLATEDVDAVLEEGGSISGRLTAGPGAGTPVTNGTVTLYWWNGGGYARVSSHETAADGSWSVSGVKPASYAIEFRDLDTGANEAWDDSYSWTDRTLVTIEPGDEVEGVDARLGGAVTSTTAPSISGTPYVGSTLTASSAWSPSGTVASYRWVVGDDRNPADDPTGTTYVPTSADLGKTIRVVATGTANRGPGWVPATATSAPTAPVTAAPAPAAPTRLAVVNLRLPEIKGRLVVGKRVRVTTGTWTPTVVEVRYRWFAGKQVFRTGDRPWVRLTRKQAGKRLRVEVTASAPGHDTLTLRTERTRAKVAPRP